LFQLQPETFSDNPVVIGDENPNGLQAGTPTGISTSIVVPLLG